MTSPHPSPEPTGSWRLSWDELAERTGATLESLERLVELGILVPSNTEAPFRSGDILHVRCGASPSTRSISSTRELKGGSGAQVFPRRRCSMLR